MYIGYAEFYQRRGLSGDELNITIYPAANAVNRAAAGELPVIHLIVEAGIELL